MFARFTTNQVVKVIDLNNETITYETHNEIGIRQTPTLKKSAILKVADTIEELCDVLIVKTKDYRGFKGKIELADLRNACGTKESLHKYLISQMKRNDLFDFAFLGIETQKGLIYVAKMNDKGELELL